MKQDSACRMKNRTAACLGILLLGALIQAASWLKGDALVFPGIPRILHAFFRLLGEEKTWLQIGVTVLHLVQTLIFSAVSGAALGLAQGLSGFVFRLFRPLMTFLRAIPMIVLNLLFDFTEMASSQR